MRFAHEIALIAGLRGPGVLAARAAELHARRTPPSPPRATAARSRTGAAARRLAGRRAATSCSAIRSGGASRPALRAWLAVAGALDARRRSERAEQPPRRSAQPAGLLVRPGAAAVRERGARMDAAVPARRRACRATRGGVLGYLVGPARREVARLRRLRRALDRRWSCSASALVFRFSWRHVAERIGARIDSLLERGARSARSREDIAPRRAGARASARKSRASRRARSRSRSTIPRRSCIEPVDASRCRRASASSRSARSRCSPSCPTPSCRRSTCSTPRRRAQETVSRRDARDDRRG